MIPKETINDVIEKTDILSLIGEYVSLKKRGQNYIGLCPFHNEKTPSFTVSPEKNLWHCFGCNEGGNVVGFVMKIENSSFIEAVKRLGDKCGVAIKSDDKGDNKVDKVYEILREAANFYHQMIFKIEAKHAYKYLLERGFSDDLIKEFKLGFSPDSRKSLLGHLKKAGYMEEDMNAAGVAYKMDDGTLVDRFRSRVMFPICNANGEVIAFGARTLNDQDKTAKYINSPENEIYHKGNILYGLNLSKDHIRKEKCVLVVEGYMDFLSPYIAGIKNIVATLGTAMTQGQARLLKRYASDVVLGYDSDSAGTEAAFKAAEILSELEINVRIAAFSRKDPDEVIKKDGIESLKFQIAQAVPYMMFRIDNIISKYDLKSAESLDQATSVIARYLALQKNEILATEYIKYTAEKLKIAEKGLIYKINQMRQAGKGKRYIAAELPYKDKFKKSEEMIIDIISRDLDKRNECKLILQPEDFIDTDFKKLYYLITNTDLISPMLVDNIGDENLRKIMTSIITKNEQREVNGLSDYIKVLKEEKIKNEIEYLKKSIHDAEEKNDPEGLRIHLQKFNEVMYKVHQNKKN